MLSKQNELYLAGHVTLKGNLSFNSAYAVSKNIAIMANGSYMDNDKTRREFRQNLIEAGGGYITGFGKNNNRILEVYGGYGTGDSKRDRRHRTQDGIISYETQKANFDKYFVQVNYSSSRKNALKLFGKKYPLSHGTALRASYLKLNEFTINGINSALEDNVFLEPVFYTRMSVNKALQLQFTSGSNFGLVNGKYLTAGNSVLSVGISFNLNK
jgi:hypothetical protein